MDVAALSAHALTNGAGQGAAITTMMAGVTTTGWTADTGIGRYLRHRYPYYNRLQYRQSGAFGGSVGRINDAPVEIRGSAARALVGGAFHQRIGLLYADVDLTRSGPTWGRRRSVDSDEPDPVWDALCARTVALAQALRAQPFVHFADPRETELVELCGVLALYEQVAVSRKSLPITEVSPAASLDELRSWIGSEVVADVRRMTALFCERLPPGLVTGPVLVEPNLHPGQADLILGGLLLELKTVVSPLISDEYAYTLLAYALKANDALPAGAEVTHVGWYFARHGTPWIYTVDDFISAFAGEQITMQAAIAEFRVLLGSKLGQHPEWMVDLMRMPVTRTRLSLPRRAGPPER